MSTDPEREEIRADCLALIDTTRAMTLSTAGDGPWAAPVYYLYRRSCFYFFSSPASRHIAEGDGKRCAAALFRDTGDAAQLQGLQMSGRIEAGRPGKDAVAAALAYAKRCGIQITTGNPIDFFKTRYRARLYRFVPEEVFYMDNRRRFGLRTKIDL